MTDLLGFCRQPIGRCGCGRVWQPKLQLRGCSVQGVLGTQRGVYTYSEGVCSGACATEDVKRNLSPNLSFHR